MRSHDEDQDDKVREVLAQTVHLSDQLQWSVKKLVALLERREDQDDAGHTGDS